MRRSWSLVAALLVVGAPLSASASTNDPYEVLQWGLRSVEAEAAWKATRGTGAVVAVVDTGVDMRHPDLKKRLLRGRDFVDDDLDPSDSNGHGTLVAGIIAASTSNGVGVASVAPGAHILPVRVLGKDGTGASEDVAEGIRWALDEGADVINLSLAQETGSGLLGESLLKDPSVDRAIKDAASAGATVVVAAGNSSDGGRPETSYDATVPGVLVVGATTRNDRRAAYAHYGAGLDLVAPGGGDASDPSDDGCTQRNSIVSTWWNPASRRSDYGGGCGTSMAVGFVSGAAALLHARGYSNSAVATRIVDTADDLGPKGRDGSFGAGRLNVRRALGVRRPSVTPKVRRPPGDGVKSQGGGRQVPSATATAGDRLDQPRRAFEPDAVAGSIDAPGAPGSRGWPVALAASLVLALAAAHSVRWARR